MSKLKQMLYLDEGLRTKPYRDTVGKLTIGIGRNLDDKGITKEESFHLLQTDIDEVTKTVNYNFAWFAALDDVRKDVVLDMVFNLGMGGFLTFKNTIKKIAAGDYEGAANNMLVSKWARQVGIRALRLSDMMRTGEYHSDYTKVSIR